MTNWNPTMELRFVERKEKLHPAMNQSVKPRTFKILQQKWYLYEYTEGEGWKRTEEVWRDVPVEQGDE